MYMYIRTYIYIYIQMGNVYLRKHVCTVKWILTCMYVQKSFAHTNGKHYILSNEFGHINDTCTCIRSRSNRSEPSLMQWLNFLYLCMYYTTTDRPCACAEHYA